MPGTKKRTVVLFTLSHWGIEAPWDVFCLIKLVSHNGLRKVLAAGKCVVWNTVCKGLPDPRVPPALSTQPLCYVLLGAPS